MMEDHGDAFSVSTGEGRDRIKTRGKWRDFCVIEIVG